MKVEIINKSKYELPEYQTSGSAGLDLVANLDEDIVLKPLDRFLVPTGLYIAVPEGYEAQIRPRSGLAYKFGISIINAVGTIDSDYRGEWKVPLVNLSNENYVLKSGERIAQVIFSKYEKVQWVEVNTLSETQRGEGGFGSTGK